MHAGWKLNDAQNILRDEAGLTPPAIYRTTPTEEYVLEFVERKGVALA